MNKGALLFGKQFETSLKGDGNLRRWFKQEHQDVLKCLKTILRTGNKTAVMLVVLTDGLIVLQVEVSYVDM